MLLILSLPSGPSIPTSQRLVESIILVKVGADLQWVPSMGLRKQHATKILSHDYHRFFKNRIASKFKMHDTPQIPGPKRKTPDYPTGLASPVPLWACPGGRIPTLPASSSRLMASHIPCKSQMNPFLWS